MAPKRAIFLSYGEETGCAETIKFIQDSGVLLTIRDLSKNHLSRHELDKMIGYLDIKHFLNTASKSYEKLKINTDEMTRDEIIDLIAQDHTLLKRPIIRSLRLITIGCDQKRIKEMLQIFGSSDQPEHREFNTRSGGGRSSHRRQTSGAGHGGRN